MIHPKNLGFRLVGIVFVAVWVIHTLSLGNHPLSLGLLILSSIVLLFLITQASYVTPQAQMKQTDRSFETTFEEVAIGLAHVDLTGQFIRVNPYLCRFLGYSEEELLKLSFQTLSLQEDLEVSLKWIKASLAGEIDHNFSKVKRYRHKEGHLVWSKLTTTLIRDEKNQPIYFLSSIQDIADLKKTEEILDDSLIKLKDAYFELQQVARIDGLTGALNVSSFKEHVEEAVNRFKRYQTPATLVFIDLDKFKQINDKHGHTTGDRVLQAVAENLKSEARETDFVGRYGGDEFAVLLTNSNSLEAMDYCERVRTSTRIKSLGGEIISAEISIGVSEISANLTDADHWLADADHHMYRNKKVDNS
jgi:diguanylate cyclase (GGDEF)-like protein/PAS domain S-box-containing protein